MTDKGFILIHGAGLGSYIWDEMIKLLNHPALAINFPNRNNSDGMNSKLRFGDYTNSVIEQISDLNVAKFVIVTHSIGGCVGLKVAEHFSNKTAGFAAIGSAIPQYGNSFISCLPFPKKIILPVIMKLAGTRPPAKAIETGLCNDLNSSQKKMVIQNFTAESRFLYTDKCNAGIPNTSRMYIKLTLDNEFPVSMQNKMANNLKAKNIKEIESGHLPMMSQPVKLAEILNNFSDNL